MRHGRIQLFTAACGLAVSLTAVAAEPPSTGEETAPQPAQTEAQTETQAEVQAGEGVTEQAETTGAAACESADCDRADCDGADCAGTGCEAAGTAEKNCWDSSTWGAGESADARCEKAGFLLGEQAFEESDGFTEGFFDNRPDPMAIRPMFSAELLMRFDADKDGSLSGQERTTTEVFLEARRSSHKSSLTYRFDFDESEDLSAAEKLEARRVLFLEQTEALNVLVEAFDADRDGVLSDNETMVARLQDAEAFFEVAFHEGRDHSFAYREGPGLPADRAEAFEAESEAMREQARTEQHEMLRAVFVAEEEAGPEPGPAEAVAEADTGDEPG